MMPLAAHYNNRGVDILSSYEIANEKALANIDRDEVSGRACAKRRKRSLTQNNEAKIIKYAVESKVNDALAYFQKALSLIVETTEHHHFYGDGLKYQPNDADGFLRHENESMAKQLVGSINPCKTNIYLSGESGCSNSYIYCKAIKIGGEKRKNDKNKSRKKDEAGDDSCCGCDFTEALIEREQQQRYQRYVNDPNSMYLTYREGYKEPVISGGYDSLTKSIFHSMICIYNIALCYQYKGKITKEKARRLMEMERNQNDRHYSFDIEINALVGASEFFLNASVDHYTRAYELMTRFRLENGPQYTLLMATMNNLAATYQSLEQSYKAEVCNRYLVRSLILIICSSERDGHLGQEVLSRSNNEGDTNGNEAHRNRSGVLSMDEDRACFESFLSNVTHLMMCGEETYRGEMTAVAA